MTTDQPGQAPTNDTLPMTPEHEQLKRAVERLTEDADVLESIYPVMTADLRLVLSRLAELERDRERLDYMINEQAAVCTNGALFYLYWDNGIGTGEWQKEDYPDARAAIDAAMTTPNTKGEAE